MVNKHQQQTMPETADAVLQPELLLQPPIVLPIEPNSNDKG